MNDPTPRVRPHRCPHCICLDDHTPMGHVDKAAPFYPLVELVDAIAWRRTEVVRELGNGQFRGSRKVHT
jgi:hypothetical protein